MRLASCAASFDCDDGCGVDCLCECKLLGITRSEELMGVRRTVNNNSSKPLPPSK